jgi:hypothetical protein
MAFDREAAKADGWTDEEIQRYMETKDQPLPAEVPRDRGEEQLGTFTSAVPDLVTYGAGLYAGKKLIVDPLIGMYKNRGGPVSPSQMAQASQMGQAAAQNVGQAAQTAQAGQAAQNVGQAARATGTGGAGAFNQMANQLGNNTIQFPKGNVTPIAPTPSAQPGMMQRGMDYANQVRQAAAQRIIPAMGQAGQAMSQAGSMFGKGLTAAAPALRIGGMASNALYSGDLNANEQAELERRRQMQPTITR